MNFFRLMIFPTVLSLLVSLRGEEPLQLFSLRGHKARGQPLSVTFRGVTSDVRRALPSSLRRTLPGIGIHPL